MPLAAVTCALAALVHAGVSISSLMFSGVGSAAGLPSDPSAEESAGVQARKPSEAAAPPIWVAPHAETRLYAGPDAVAEELAPLYQWAGLQVEGAAREHRLPVLDPSRQLHGWVPADDVGPIDPALLGSAYLPPVGRPIAWGGAARVTMYTCVELGGCAPTASGLWPELGMVAVDPRVIPLGSTVWIQGVGTFLATDTGSLVRGAHLDIYSLSYQEAINWGVQQRSILVFAP